MNGVKPSNLVSQLSRVNLVCSRDSNVQRTETEGDDTSFARDSLKDLSLDSSRAPFQSVREREISSQTPRFLMKHHFLVRGASFGEHHFDVDRSDWTTQMLQ